MLAAGTASATSATSAAPNKAKSAKPASAKQRPEPPPSTYAYVPPPAQPSLAGALMFVSGRGLELGFGPALQEASTSGAYAVGVSHLMLRVGSTFRDSYHYGADLNTGARGFFQALVGVGWARTHDGKQEVYLQLCGGFIASLCLRPLWDLDKSAAGLRAAVGAQF